MTEKEMSSFDIPFIDVEATSQNLKTLREEHNIKVSDIQTLLNMENPQSIYNWENPEKKILPRLDNLVVLSKLYEVNMDKIIIIKHSTADTLSVSDVTSAYGISQITIDYVKEHSSPKVYGAISNYYNI